MGGRGNGDEEERLDDTKGQRKKWMTGESKMYNRNEVEWRRKRGEGNGEDVKKRQGMREEKGSCYKDVYKRNS